LFTLSQGNTTTNTKQEKFFITWLLGCTMATGNELRKKKTNRQQIAAREKRNTTVTNV